MIVLTLNSGSTSIKLGAYAATDRTPVRLRSEHHTGGEIEPEALLEGFLHALRAAPAAIVHRVVHGGSRFHGATLLDDASVAEIGALSELAPLHNPQALKWIGIARAVCPATVAQVAVFDTAYFSRLPRVAAEYALPPRLGVEQGVRRYGFHGLAHEAMWRRWCELYPELPGGGRLITVQLGGGCSVTALDAGQPLDNSMGFSPLEGLVMATRSGDVDPSILPYLEKRLSASSQQLLELLNTQAGLAGVAGKDGNPTQLLADPDPRSQFAVELYCYRLRKYLGAYCAVLGGCDGIAFGGGVGEHSPEVRARALAGMSWAGFELDAAANEAARGKEAAIHSSGSRVRVHVIPVDEETIMVRAAVNLLRGDRSPLAGTPLASI